VLVASNRGPVSFGFAADGSLTSRRGGGGMVSGMMSGLTAAARQDDVLWICAALSDADRAVARQDPGAARAGGEAPVRMLDIPPVMFTEAYNGVANSVLWFTHHLLFDTPNQPRFGPGFRRQWASYAAYNETFAAALAEEAAAAALPPASVLIQDYHLALAPRLLRNTRPDARIAHFSHTPWAPPDYYRLLPDDVARAVLDGILGADRAGFLARRWAGAFLDCCEAVLGAEVEREAGRPAAGGCTAGGSAGGTAGRVTYRGHTTEVAVYPLGVDAPALRARAREYDVEAHAAALAEATRGRKLIVRIDRTELSKNVLRGLAAYRELLVTRPEWRGQVTHLAFAYPSRSELAEYRAYTERVHELAREINDEFGTGDWEPLILDVKDDYPRSLAACRIADVLLVNPIRDGMNLVAEEGPILSGRGCVLVLSREAGAAAVLGGDALVVNPYDVTATADALHEALTMPAAERQRRCAALAATAASLAPGRWLADQLSALG